MVERKTWKQRRKVILDNIDQFGFSNASLLHGTQVSGDIKNVIRRVGIDERIISWNFGK